MTPAAEPPGRWLGLVRAVASCLTGLPRYATLSIAVSWMVLIWALSSGSFDTPPGVPSRLWSLAANLAHAPLFGLLALLALGTLCARGVPAPRPSRAALCGAFLWALAWGVIDELHQSGTPGRHASAYDVVTDAVGALLVLWVAGYVTSERAHERGLLRRLGLGLVVCLLTAGVVTLVGAPSRG